MGTPKDSEKTRAKIIEAAGKLFAERGFKGVTVRDIVKKADTHLSALNYHFRTKKDLYREVLMQACRDESFSSNEQKQLLRREPHKALHDIITGTMEEYRKQTTANWQTNIITRECWEPSDVFMETVKTYFKPQTDFIAQIIGKIADKPIEDHQVRFAMIVLIGLVDTFSLYGQLIDAIAPGLPDHLKKKNLLADQILHLVVEAAKAPVGE